MGFDVSREILVFNAGAFRKLCVLVPSMNAFAQARKFKFQPSHDGATGMDLRRHHGSSLELDQELGSRCSTSVVNMSMSHFG